MKLSDLQRRIAANPRTVLSVSLPGQVAARLDQVAAAAGLGRSTVAARVLAAGLVQIKLPVAPEVEVEPEPQAELETYEPPPYVYDPDE